MIGIGLFSENVGHIDPIQAMTRRKHPHPRKTLRRGHRLMPRPVSMLTEIVLIQIQFGVGLLDFGIVQKRMVDSKSLQISHLFSQNFIHLYKNFKKQRKGAFKMLG
jgi:hypothetical protein